MDLTSHCLPEEARLLGLIQLHCPGLAIPRGGRALRTRYRSLGGLSHDSHLIQHSFIPQIFIVDLLHAGSCVDGYLGSRTE